MRGKARGVADHVMVFAPAPRLTVTIEQRGGVPDIHLHPGGQGIWQAGMVRALGVPVVACAYFGGETGRVARALLDDQDMGLRAVVGASVTGAYVHDRRGSVRVVVAEEPGEPLSRHEVDELYGIALAEGLRAGVCVLGGPGDPPVLSPDVYRRLTIDLAENGCLVITDLRGEHLRAAAAAGARVLKVSHEELLEDGVARSGTLHDLIDAGCALREAGAGTVIVTRAEHPALVVTGDAVSEVVTPRMEPFDPSGSGDSMTAAIAASLARDLSIGDAIRTGAAAGALNVTHHGLGTAQPDAVAQLCQRVHLRPVRELTPAGGGPVEGPHLRATPEQLAERIRRQ
jgi:1-phosphofructokinase